MAMPCVIFDLDGTLADTRHRLHFIEKTPKDWQGFFNACKDDIPCASVVSLFHMLQGQLPIFICSGRPASHRAVTIEWLTAHRVYPASMYMRPEKDFRPDTIVKKEMLGTIRGIGYEPEFAVEDRPEVVDMWRENNVPCFVVDQAPWVPQLQRAAGAAVLQATLQFLHATGHDDAVKALTPFAEKFK